MCLQKLKFRHIEEKQLIMRNKILNEKRILLSILLICISILWIYADEKPKKDKSRVSEKADKDFKLYKFNKAIRLYKKVYNNINDKQEKGKIAEQLGICFMRNNEYEDAENWFEKAFKNDPNPALYLQLADAVKRQGNYSLAKEYLNKYMREYPTDSNIASLISYCDSAVIWEANPKDIIIEKFVLLNTKFNDFSPMLAKDNSIYFTSDRPIRDGAQAYAWTGLPYTDIFYCSYDVTTEKYEKPIPYELINTPFNDGVICFNSKNNELYYTQCNGRDGKQYNCRIMMIKKRGQKWTDPKVASFCTDTFANYGHPTLSDNGKRIYFSSNMLGGYGEEKENGTSLKTTDLYMCSFVSRAKTWGNPINLGTEINSEGNEQFPYLYNNTLYFSSDGLPGMGGLDIFSSEKVNQNWSIPENMKAPLNSPADDFGIVIERDGNLYAGYKGMFSSNRNGSKRDDIYSFKIPPIVFNVHGLITNAKNQKLEPCAKVLLSYDDTTLTTIADQNAYYEFLDISPQTTFVIFAQKDSFFDSKKIAFSTNGLKVSKDFEIDLQITPFPSYDEIVKLEGIFYDLDSFNLRPESLVVLDSLANILMKYPRLVIELAAHTDCRQTYAYNRELSQKRAKACVDYLIYKGIDARRLIAIGYGESKLVNNCDCENGKGNGMDCTEEEHQINRRTTIAIIRTDFNPNEE